MMDREIRAAGLAGNLCALVLVLDGVPDADFIRHRCNAFQRRFPLAMARLVWRGKQYHWNHQAQQPIPFRLVHVDSADPQQRHRDELTTDVLNRPVEPESASPFELTLIVYGATSQLVLRWFHPAFDAKGAELVLYHLFGEGESGGQTAGSVLDKLLSDWGLWQKIKLGYRAKRMIEQLDQASSTLPSRQTTPSTGYAFDVTNLGRERSTLVFEHAKQQVGMTAISLYFIGCMMRALDKTRCEDPGDAYCVPYAMNLRRRKALFPVFGNQVSFLFAQAPCALVADRSGLFKHLREQSMMAVRQGYDRAMLPLMQAGSWLSLEKMGQIVRYSAKRRERASFWYSHTGEMDPEIVEVGGCAVKAVHPHSPVTAPPSLGLLVGQHQGAIILSLNFIPEHFAAGWIGQLRTALIDELLSDQVA